MKKILSLISILALVTLALTACSPDQNAADQSPAPTQQAAAGTTANDPQTESDASVEEAKTYFGMIKQVVGNEITLELAENPNEAFDEEAPNGDSSDMATASMEAVPMTAALPAGSLPDTPVEEHMELSYTGEEKAFTIPAGAPIYDLTSGQSVQLSGLKKGAVVAVTVQGENDAAVGVEIWE